MSSVVTSQITSASKSYAMIGGILATLIALSFLIAGLYLIIRPNPYTVTTTATVTSSMCTVVGGTQDSSCTVQYTYIVDGVVYLGQLTLVSINAYNVGQTFQIQYDPSNPNNSRYYQTPPPVVGGYLIAVSVIITAIAWTIVAFTSGK